MTPPKRLSPQREQEIRTQLIGMEHVRELLAEIDVLRAERDSIAKENQRGIELAQVILFGESLQKERDELRAENGKLRERIEILKNAIKKVKHTAYFYKEIKGIKDIIINRCAYDDLIQALAKDDEDATNDPA